MPNSDAYWFRAKAYGWGWGPPANWQGWTFFLAWIVFLGAGLVRLPRHHLGWWGYLAGMIGLLVVVCWLKGEPRKWRRGDPSK